MYFITTVINVMEHRLIIDIDKYNIKININFNTIKNIIIFHFLFLFILQVIIYSLSVDYYYYKIIELFLWYKRKCFTLCNNI